MKQSEIISTNIGDGAATIFECSNNSKTTPLPRLTILMPFRLGYPDQKDEPAASLCLGADATKQLYDFLRRYFQTVAESPND